MKVTTAISFGDIALRKGYLSKEALQEALLVHAVASKRRQNVSLGQVMVQSGFLSSDQAQEIERDQQEILHAQAEADLPEEVVVAMQSAANRIGKFVKLELLGRGGVGEVWRAYDLVIRRMVAIKFLHTMTPDHWQRFVKEAQILGKLQHPNIVPLYEIGDRFIVMPHIHGKTLDRTKLSVRQAADVVRQAAVAIAHAHAQGIIHRDIKPSNIMLEGRTVFVTDFGIAKELQVKESLSTTGDILGTPSYMSPEQVRARTRDIDARTDVYALGATLYHLVTGTVAFCNEDLYEMMRAIQEDDPVRPSRLNPDVPRDLEAIILKAMEKASARRYKTAREMAADLDRFLKGDPVEARPSGALDRLGRRLAKHKAQALLISLALIGVGFGVYGVNAPSKNVDEGPSQQSKAAGNYADTYLQNKEYDKAIDAASKAIEADPNNPSAYYARGRALWLKGDRDAALKDFEKYGSFGSEFEKLVDLFMHSQDPASWQAPNDHRLSDFYATRASQNNKKQDYGSALSNAEKAILADPKNPGGYFARGCAYWGQGDVKKARADFDTCVKLGPEFEKLIEPYLKEPPSKGQEQLPAPQQNLEERLGSNGLVNDASQFTIQKNYAAALEAANKAVIRDPENPSAYFARARALWLKGDREGATKDFDKYKSFGPEYGKLVEQFMETQKTDPPADEKTMSEFYANRSGQNMMKMDYATALEAAEKAIAADPLNPGGYFARGRAHWFLGHREKANEDFRKCIQLGPEYVTLIDAYLNPKKGK